MAREATTLNTWAIAVARFLDSAGCDSNRLLREAGLDPEILKDPNGRYPVSKMTRLWQLAVRETGDASLGLKAAAFIQPATFHGLGLALLASQSLLDALQRSSRYSRIVSNAADIVIELQPAAVKEIIRFRDDIEVAVESVDMIMASALTFGRMMTGLTAFPLEVRMRRPEPAGAAAAAFRDYFGCPIEFGADENSLLLDRALAERPLPMANPALARQNDQVVMEYLARFDGARISEKVRAELITRLPAGEPSRAEVASTLHMSEKTLQRRLKDEDTSYQDILDETRRELAQQYLREGRISVCEITFRLGFSDQSSFTRAFKRWTGSAPGEYRGRLN